MIPYFSNDTVLLEAANSTVVRPSKTYKLDLTSGRIIGMIDGISAVRQAILKQLLTERYVYLIYDWNYGIGLEKYIGLGISYLRADIKSALTECLLKDERILSVEDVTVKLGTENSGVLINFKVSTIYGDISETVVNNNVL